MMPFKYYHEGFSLLNHKQKKEFILLFVIGLVSSILQVLFTFSFLPFISYVLGTVDSQFITLLLSGMKQFGIQIPAVIVIAIISFILLVLTSLCMLLYSYRKNQYIYGLNEDFSKMLFRKFLKKEYTFYFTHNTSEFSKEIVSDAFQFSNIYMISLLEILVNTFMISIFALGLGVISRTALFFLFLILAFIYIAINTFTKTMRIDGRVANNSNRERFKIISDALSNIKMIKSYRNETLFLDQYAEAAHKYALANIRNLKHHEGMRIMLEFLIFFILLSFSIIYMTFFGQLFSILPIFSVFIVSMYRILPSIQKINLSISNLAFNIDLVRNIQLIQDSNEFSKQEYFKESFKFLELKDINYTYPNRRERALSRINLEVRRNQFVGIMGKSGSGKSTLLDILMGLIKADNGTYSINGSTLHSINTQDLFAYISQSTYLIDDTIRNNILFGKDDDIEDTDKLKQILRKVDLYEFIMSTLPMGIDTIVGENGINLSGGQRQRIGIARALYKDSDILIFDEATSSLDSQTEQKIMTTIQEISQEKTIIMVSHRMSDLMDADIVYSIKNGKLERNEKDV